MSNTGTRVGRLRKPTTHDVLTAVQNWVPRLVPSGHQQRPLPGPTAVDVARAYDTDSSLVLPTLTALVAAGTLRVVKTGPYRCYLWGAPAPEQSLPHPHREAVNG